MMSRSDALRIETVSDGPQGPALLSFVLYASGDGAVEDDGTSQPTTFAALDG